MQSRFSARALCLYGAASLAVSGQAGCGDSTEPILVSQAAMTTPSPGAAEQYVERGQQLASSGDYSAAVEEYTAALDALRQPTTSVMQPEAADADVLFDRGVAYLAMGFPDTASADFSEVLRIQPDDGAAYARRGEAYAKLRDFYKAVRDCTDAIRFDADNAAAYRYRSEAYLARGQYERCVADGEQAVKLQPTLEGELRPLVARAYRGWSAELADAGEPVEAAAKLARARELDPAVAVVASTAQDPERDGDPVRQTAAKEVVDEAREHYERGVTAWTAGQRDAAIDAWTVAIAARGDFAEAYLSRGRALLEMGFPDTAAKDLEQAAHLGGPAIEAYRLQAKAFLQLGAPHRTVLSATDALHEDPLDAASYALRGRGYLKIGKWDRAIRDLEQAVRLEPALADDVRPTLAEAYRQRDVAQASAARPVTPVGPDLDDLHG
jgi:tetratricopeptide (TPR) repeat protein